MKKDQIFIIWDLESDEAETKPDLPDTVKLPDHFKLDVWLNMSDPPEDAPTALREWEEEVVDWLSDEYGWLVKYLLLPYHVEDFEMKLKSKLN